MGNLTDKVKKEVQNAASGFETTAKDIVQKYNPFNKKINKEGTSDTGAESIRLANRTIKSTTNTIKTTESVVKKSRKALVKTTKITVKVTAWTFKVLGTTVTHIAAFASNPVVLIAALILLIILLIVFISIPLLGGGIAGALNNERAYTDMAGLTNISDQLQEGRKMFEEAVKKRREEYEALINDMYFSNDDLTHSDLVYMERTIYGDPTTSTTYQTGFASGEYKETLKNAWNLQLDVNDALAIAYVYIEKKENEAYYVEGELFDVEFTQEIFDEMLRIIVQFVEEKYENYPCPDENCTINEAWKSACSDLQTDVEMVRNAVSDKNDVYLDWMQSNAQALINNPNDANAYNDLIEDINHFRGIVSNELIDWLKANANRVANKDTNGIPQYICNHKHSLHSIGFSSLTKEDLMTALKFSDIDIQWVEMSKSYIESLNNTDEE